MVKNDQSSYWQTSPRHAVHGSRATTHGLERPPLRFVKLRRGKQVMGKGNGLLNKGVNSVDL